MTQIEVKDEGKKCLSSKTLETFDIARNNFLLQINTFRKANINLTSVKDSGLIKAKPVVFLTKRAHLKMRGSSIKIYVDVKNVLKKFKEKGIVNKKCRPICYKKICSQEDYRIINQIAAIAYDLMHFYSCVDNL